jgi:thiol-disulfide isomerase/thioredoxin
MPRFAWISAALIGLALTLAMPGVAGAGLEGKPAPKLQLRDASGERRSLADVAAGRPAIVLFWASWCPYCKALMPHLAQIQRRHGNAIAVIAVSVWEEAEVDPAAVLAERGYAFEVLLKGDKSGKRWGVKGTPGLFVVGRDGIVVFDRNARPIKTDSGSDQPVVTDRARLAARSAEHWAAAVAEAIDAALKAPAVVSDSP